MRKFVLCSLLLVVVSSLALNAFGHAGEVHTSMGTITMLHPDGSFMMKKTDGTTIVVAVSKNTRYLHSDGRVATHAELAVRKRVVVTMAKDGKTATTIKLAAGKQSSNE
jgi:hypothetical protein